MPPPQKNFDILALKSYVLMRLVLSECCNNKQGARNMKSKLARGLNPRPLSTRTLWLYIYVCELSDTETSWELIYVVEATRGTVGCEEEMSPSK